jgi:hypothetical protein
MNKNVFVPMIILLIAACVLAVGGTAARIDQVSGITTSGAQNGEATSTYTNREFRISMRYTSDFKQVEGIDGQLFDEVDVKFNRATPIATFVYTSPKYAGRNSRRPRRAQRTAQRSPPAGERLSFGSLAASPKAVKHFAPSALLRVFRIENLEPASRLLEGCFVNTASAT